VSSFQQEALTKQQEADAMWSKLSNVRRMIAKLLKTMNDVRIIVRTFVIPMAYAVCVSVYSFDCIYYPFEIVLMMIMVVTMTMTTGV